MMYLVSITNQNRKQSVPEVQEILTKYGKNITTRLGIRDPEDEKRGIIVVTYDGENVDEFVETLNMIQSVNVNYMEM